MLQPVIIAGGSGTRLWPLSRSGFPKQFLSLGGTETLFQRTCNRCKTIKDAIKPPLVVTTEDYRFLVQEQLSEIGFRDTTLLLEPVGKNTAPAMTLAALHSMVEHDDPIMLVLPADHEIKNEQGFTEAVMTAAKLAAKNALVVLGVVPTSANTGYGYIKADGDTVTHFVEKPDIGNARQYLKDGSYFWNAGIFVVKSSVWLKILEQFRPDIAIGTLNAWQHKTIDNRFIRPNQEYFKAIPAESIDRAVIEHLPSSNIDIKMISLDVEWSDLGSWDAVWQTAPINSEGNAIFGDVLAFGSMNNYIHSSSRMLALVGVNDIAVIETADAVLVTDKKNSQDVRKIVEKLKLAQREESDFHRKVFRPWGWYDCLDEGEGFKVKRIQVSPGCSLSLQKHNHRAEHWIVVKGSAEVTCGDHVFNLTKNQSTYIPLGQVHRLANPNKTILEIIEVQSGNYLGEDDIERFSDEYGR